MFLKQIILFPNQLQLKTHTDCRINPLAQMIRLVENLARYRRLADILDPVTRPTKKMFECNNEKEE